MLTPQRYVPSKAKPQAPTPVMGQFAESIIEPAVVSL